MASQVLQEVGDEVEGYMTGLIGKDRPDKDADITILTKYIVAPEKAKDFIEAIKKVRGCEVVQFSNPSH